MMYSAIAIIFNKDSEVLVLKRMEPQKDFSGLWGFPGGGLEDDETFDECAVRETKEETTLEISNLEYVGTDRGFVWVYTTRKYIGNVKLDFEHTDYAWVSIEDLPNYKTIPGSKKLIKEALKL